MEWAAFKAALSLIPRWAWAALGLAVVIGLCVHEYHGRLDAEYERGKAEVQATFDAHLRADKLAMAEAAKKARAIEAAQRKAMADAAARWKKDKDHAIATERAVADGLRAGNLRLRKQWQGCPAQGAAQAADGGQGGDDNADLRAAGAGRIVRLAASADAQVTYLQGLIRSAPQCFTVVE